MMQDSNLRPGRFHTCDPLELEGLQEMARRYRSVSVIGLGYVGLPTAMLFAKKGMNVLGVDIDEQVLERIRASRVPELYPELAEWWYEVKGLENFSVDRRPCPSDIFIIAVPTPVHDEKKTCDLRAVKSAMYSILPVLEPGNLIVLESTVPPGTTSRLIRPMLEDAGFKVGEDVHLCFSPERVLPGRTTHELVHNDRILGATTRQSALLAKAILSNLIEGEIYTTDDITAEFCKLAENTYRDVNIALANELYVLADEYGVDMGEARHLINLHPRVNLLKPGIGVGGHCIAVDPWFFVESSPEKTQLIATSRRVNDRMPAYTADKIARDLREHGIENPRICCVGLTYKPDVVDTRESPALRVVDLLKGQGSTVVTFDPLVEEYRGQTLSEAVRGADYLAVLVNHSVIQAELALNLEKIKSQMRTPLVQVF